MPKKIKYLLLDFFLAMYLIPFRRIVRWLPLKVVYILAEIVACFLYVLDRSDVKNTCEFLFQGRNVQLSQKRINQIVRESYEIFVKRHFEDLFMGHLTADDFERIVTIDGLAHLDRALQNGNGVIIQLAHFGSFMFILPALAFKGYTINQLVGDPDLKHHRRIHKLMFNAKVKENSLLPVNFIHADKSIRPAVAALKNNELLAMALDGRDGDDWITVPMCGRQINLSPGNFKLASLTGASILPVFILRNKDNTHRIVIEKPFAIEKQKMDEKRLWARMKQLALVFERYFFDHPSHIIKTINEIERRAERGIITTAFFNRDFK